MNLYFQPRSPWSPMMPEIVGDPPTPAATPLLSGSESRNLNGLVLISVLRAWRIGAARAKRPAAPLFPRPGIEESQQLGPDLLPRERFMAVNEDLAERERAV